MAGVEIDGLLVLVFDSWLILREPVEVERPVVMGVVVGWIQFHCLTKDLRRVTVSHLL